MLYDAPHPRALLRDHKGRLVVHGCRGVGAERHDEVAEVHGRWAGPELHGVLLVDGPGAPGGDVAAFHHHGLLGLDGQVPDAEACQGRCDVQLLDGRALLRAADARQQAAAKGGCMALLRDEAVAHDGTLALNGDEHDAAQDCGDCGGERGPIVLLLRDVGGGDGADDGCHSDNF